MKKTFASLLMVALMATACTKNSHSGGLDDTIASSNTQSKTEDNPDRVNDDNGGSGSGKSDDSRTAVTVPTAVKTAFAKLYPDATKVEWQKLSDGNYKAEFYRGTVKWQAIFTPTGTLVKQEHD